jgi:NAD(P)-dependent dehydrogenase (short-subunit alcohol dehydrogenase family)
VSASLNSHSPINSFLAADSPSSDPNSIGFIIGQELAFKGVKVYLSARSDQKANDAVTELLSRARAGQKKVDAAPLVMDLESFQQVKDAAQRFLQQEERLDVLVHNAAM